MKSSKDKQSAHMLSNFDKLMAAEAAKVFLPLLAPNTPFTQECACCHTLRDRDADALAYAHEHGVQMQMQMPNAPTRMHGRHRSGQGRVSLAARLYQDMNQSGRGSIGPLNGGILVGGLPIYERRDFRAFTNRPPFLHKDLQNSITARITHLENRLATIRAIMEREQREWAEQQRDQKIAGQRERLKQVEKVEQVRHQQERNHSPKVVKLAECDTIKSADKGPKESMEAAKTTFLEVLLMMVRRDGKGNNGGGVAEDERLG